MFGKFFASTFTGSMFGAGPPVFAVWAYVIANTVDSQVELNPTMLAAVLGTTKKEVEKAIQTLCSPDQNSRSKEHDGKRLIKEGEFAYFVPNHARYRNIQNEDARREYNRKKKAEYRAAAKDVNVSQRKMSTMSTHTEAEAEAEAEKKSPNITSSQDTKIKPSHTSPRGRETVSHQFEIFWRAYPRHEARKAALKVWNRLNLDNRLGEVLGGVEAWKRAREPAYMPYAQGFLNQELWKDEPLRGKETPRGEANERQRRTKAAIERAIQSAPGEVAGETSGSLPSRTVGR